MTTTQTHELVIHALPASVLEHVRRDGVGVSGIPIAHVTAEGGEPLRCCLRNATPGTEMILFGYEPPLPASPYREIGAVYAHAEPCAGRDDTSEYPPDWIGRPQVLRGYDDRGWIHATSMHDGSQPAAAIATMLDDPDVVVVHSRNVEYGCFMFAVTRGASR